MKISYSLRSKITVVALVQFCTRASTKLRQLFWNGGSMLLDDSYLDGAVMVNL